MEDQAAVVPADQLEQQVQQVPFNPIYQVQVAAAVAEALAATEAMVA
jgi:hypothetical protein